MPDKPEADPFKSSSTSVPQPEGTTPPVNEKPRTVVPPAETVKPYVAASPPDALTIVAPSTLN